MLQRSDGRGLKDWTPAPTPAERPKSGPLHPRPPARLLSHSSWCHSAATPSGGFASLQQKKMDAGVKMVEMANPVLHSGVGGSTVIQQHLKPANEPECCSASSFSGIDILSLTLPYGASKHLFSRSVMGCLSNTLAPERILL